MATVCVYVPHACVHVFTNAHMSKQLSTKMPDRQKQTCLCTCGHMSRHMSRCMPRHMPRHMSGHISRVIPRPRRLKQQARQPRCAAYFKKYACPVTTTHTSYTVQSINILKAGIFWTATDIHWVATIMNYAMTGICHHAIYLLYTLLEWL